MFFNRLLNYIDDFFFLCSTPVDNCVSQVSVIPCSFLNRFMTSSIGILRLISGVTTACQASTELVARGLSSLTR